MIGKYLQQDAEVLGTKWTVYFCGRDFYRRKAGKGTSGITYSDTKSIYLVAKNLLAETVVHELFHAYKNELCVDSANLDAEQTEEFCAEVMAKYGQRILDQARELYNEFLVRSKK